MAIPVSRLPVDNVDNPVSKGILQRVSRWVVVRAARVTTMRTFVSRRQASLPYLLLSPAPELLPRGAKRGLNPGAEVHMMGDV